MPRSVFAAVAVTASAVCLTSCGSSSSTPSTPTSPSSPSPSAVTITINGQNGAQSFSPNPAPDGGQMVVFRNTDNTVHHIVLNDGSVDTGNIAPGATSAAVMMPANGTNYHCTIHPTMVGAVNASGGTAPPPCEGIYCNTAH
jgi:plastocyanin